MKHIKAEIEALERRITAANYINQLETGLDQVKDALKHLDKDEHVRKMLEDVEHLEKDYNKFMVKVMDTVEPLT